MQKLYDAFKKKMLNRFSGHGLPNVFRTRNVFKQILWTLTWITGLCLSVVLINESINKYFKYEVVTNSRFINEYPILFPKVTFCNIDPFTTNKSIDFLTQVIHKHALNRKAFNKKFHNNLNLVNYYIENEKDNSFRSISMFEANRTNNSIKKSLGYSIHDIIFSCQFGVWKCDLDHDFEWTYNYKFGNCFTFNPSNEKEKMISVYQSGKMNGLQIEMIIGKEDNYESFVIEKGVRVFIYNHTTAYSDNDSVNIAVGKETSINLRKKIQTKKPKPFSDCVIIDNTKPNSSMSDFYNVFIKSNLTYRQQDCLTLCYQMLLIKECECFDIGVGFFNLFQIDSPHACQKKESSCIEKIFRHPIHNYYKICYEKCPIECHTVDYDFEVNFAGYPTATHLKRIKKTRPTLMGHIDHSEDKVLKVNIHFNQMNYEKVVEEAALTMASLLANIGGILGLFLGFSVMSMFEIVEIISQMITVSLNILIVAVYKKTKQTEVICAKETI